jgi:hypothetical protein
VCLPVIADVIAKSLSAWPRTGGIRCIDAEKAHLAKITTTDAVSVNDAGGNAKEQGHAQLVSDGLGIGKPHNAGPS